MPPTANYAHEVKLALPFDQAVSTVVDALKSQGFGVLTEIDVQETLRQKLEVEFRRYLILGACNPPLAHKALTSELSVGLLLPCNAVVYENDDGSSTVALLDPVVLFNLSSEPALTEVAAEAAERLQRVADSLQGT